MEESHKTFQTIFLTFLGLLFVGTIGYYMVGQGTLWQSFFTTVIVLLTHFEHWVHDPVPKQILSVVLVTGSYFIVAYLIKLTADYFLGGEYREHRRKIKMVNKIGKMKDHYIVCGFGRVGKQVAEDLFHTKADFVILDRDQREINRALNAGYDALCGDPTEEKHLLSVGIGNAKALISCLGCDTDNLFVTLTARALNQDLYIVSRADDETNKLKFEKAGANRVAIPYQIGGYHMATMALRPAVLDFLDVIVDSRHDELEVEEVEVPRGSFLIGKTISDELARDKTGLTILAINHHDGSSKVNPNGQELIHQGDKLIVMGNRKQLDQLTELVT
jgi:voltage-gated potassium channel